MPLPSRKKLVMLCAAAVATAAWSAPVATTGIPASAYVQNGLVGHWDGIDNAGTGSHDANATTWKNLVSGGKDLAKQSGMGGWVDGNAFNCDNKCALTGPNRPNSTGRKARHTWTEPCAIA